MGNMMNNNLYYCLLDIFPTQMAVLEYINKLKILLLVWVDSTCKTWHLDYIQKLDNRQNFTT